MTSPDPTRPDFPEFHPRFLVIEGIDRSGKNLQANLIEHKMAELGVPVRKFSTPDYNDPSGETIARHLTGSLYMSHEGRRSAHDPIALTCLQICNRYAVASRIRQAIAERYSIVCVRWWQSALLYGAEDGVDETFVRAASAHLPEPDLHLLLDADADRVASRLDPESRYEADPARQRRLAEAYRRLWSSFAGDPGWKVVSADADPGKVSDEIWRIVVGKS